MKYHQNEHLSLIKKENFEGNIILLGFGSVNKGLLPILFNHFDITSDRITIITKDNRNRDIAEEYGVLHVTEEIREDNYISLLDRFCKSGDIIANLTVDVDTCALIDYCQENNILYVDTCNEPWKGGYDELPPEATLEEKLLGRSNHSFRCKILEKRGNSKATCVTSHGMNPGIVSHFVKQALLDIAAIEELKVPEPTTREEWAALAKTLGVKVVQISEHDTQVSNITKQDNEKVCTWSAEGFVSEGSQAAEMGYGTHEKQRFSPENKGFEQGVLVKDGRVALLNAPGIRTRILTWTPNRGQAECFLITHNESLSLSEYFGTEDYGFTCYYAYRACNDAIISMLEYSGDHYKIQTHERILCEEITDGMDELGVLLCYTYNGVERVYWYGSTLNIHQARMIAPYNSATSLQVVSGVISAMIYAIRHPNEGVIEAEDMDYREVLNIAKPYLGEIIGVSNDWNPLAHRKHFFEEDLDEKDVWQFKNFRML